MQYNDCVWCVWQSTGCSYCRTGWLVFHEPWKAVVRKEAVAALKAIWCTLFQEGRKVAAVLGLLGPLSDTLLLHELSACSMIGSSWIWGNDPFGVCWIPGAPDICAWPAWQSKSVKIQHVPGSFGILWVHQHDKLIFYCRLLEVELWFCTCLHSWIFLLMLRSYLTTYKNHPRQILDHS